MMRQLTAIILALFTSIAMSGCLGDTAQVDEYGISTMALTQGSECGKVTAPLLSYNGLYTGSAVISNTATDITVSVNADTINGYSFSDLHIYAGTNPMPRLGHGVDLFLFPVKRSYVGQTGVSDSATLPLVDLVAGDACGTSLYVAVRANMKTYDGSGNITGEYPAWAYTEEYIGSTCPCAGNELTYTVCCTPPPVNTGCTLTQGYWKTHNEFAKNRSQRINWPAPLDENGKLCPAETRTNLKLLQLSNAGGNAYLILAKQYLAAQLNVASGASTTAQVAAAMADAAVLLNNNCGQFVQASTVDGTAMTLLGGVLDAYNNGFVGPGHCGAN